MEKVIKKISFKTLSILLAFLMIASPLATIVADFDWGTLVGASGDDSGDVVHQNTSYSNTEFSVVSGIALVGSGVAQASQAEYAEKLAAALRSNGDAISVEYYASLADVPASANLVVYACGTKEAIDGDVPVDDFADTLTQEVANLKKQGKDVMLVTPGPVVAYGDGMRYDTENPYSHYFTPEGVNSGANVYNAVQKFVDTINNVAQEQDVHVLSIQGKASLFGVSKYMEGTTNGVYPASYDLMVAWVADYIAENYVIAGANSLIKEATVGADADEYVVDFGTSYSDFDAVVVTVPAGKQVPANLSVQTTKHENDQWFEAVARTKQTVGSDDVFTASIVFDASTARYVRVAGDTALPAGTTIKFFKTRLAAPTITNPVDGQSLSTKQAFNIEWSNVANADRYIVTIKNKADGSIVKEVATSSDVQAFPTGILTDGVTYTVTVESVGSGYFGTGDEIHGGVSNTVEFTADVKAPLVDNSESTEEDVSAGKLLTIGDVINLSAGKTFSINNTGFVSSPVDKSLAALTDGTFGTQLPTGETSEYVFLSDINISDSDKTAILTLDLGAEYSLYSIYFDTAFVAGNLTANAQPESVQFGWSSDNSSYQYSDMYVSNSTRTIKNGDVTVGMTKYLRTTDVTARYIQIVIDLSQANVYRNLCLDEIVVLGYQESPNVIVRDGAYYLNKHLVGPYRFDGNYTAGAWENGIDFVAVAPDASNTPIEFVIDLNEDYNNNAVDSGNHLVSSLDIGYAIDTSAYRPSSITVAVQKENETTWTTVGGKVYTDVPVSPSYVDEKIALTNADASDVYAARVKVTLYTDKYISSVPAAFDSTGFWGNWFALSYMKLVGGQYIGSIEPDGATAAYHANYLQNTDLVGRNNFGDVNSNEIWNSIAWKSAGYKVSNSGYSDAVGNITVGKVYWASEISGASNAPATDTTTQTPTAVNPNYNTTQTVNALATSYFSAISLYSGKTTTSNGLGTVNYNNQRIPDSDLSALINGTAASGSNAGVFVRTGTNGTTSIEVTFTTTITVTSVALAAYIASGFAISGIVLEVPSTGTSWNTVAGSFSASSSQYTYTLNSSVNTTKIRITYTNGAYSSGISEIFVEGTKYTAPVTPPSGKVYNLAPGATYAYTGMLPGDGMGYAEGTQGVVMAEDYVTPNYNAGYNSTTYAQGGSGHRNTLGQYAKGKLNDGVFANYSAGMTPYRWVGWYQGSSQPTAGMTITFDLGGLYHLNDIYFYNSGRDNQANAHSAHTVNIYFKANATDAWSSAYNATPTQDGTLQKSSTNTQTHPRWKFSLAAAPSGQYRYVMIVIDNNSGSYTNTHFYMDEVVINGYVPTGGPDLTDKNWASHDNGGRYKGYASEISAAGVATETFTTGSDWDAFHSGEVNDGKIGTAYADSPWLTKTNGDVHYTFRLASRVDITSVEVYVHPRLLDGSYLYPSYIDVYVGEEDDESSATQYCRITSSSNHAASTSVSSQYVKKFSHTGNITGKYVFFVINAPAYYTYVPEIVINGVKSAQLDAPEITSHIDEQEIGVETDLDWTDVSVSGESLTITYNVTVAGQGTTKTTEGLMASQVQLDDSYFTGGEGYYTVTVSSNAAGWISGSTSIVLYYAPKYIITFYAADGALIKSAGQSGENLQFGIYQGLGWDSDEVQSVVAGVSAMPYNGTDGQLYYFSHWVSADGEAGVPTEGSITSNVSFYAQYSTTDVNGTTSAQNPKLTDGIVFNGAGSVADYYFTFNNDNQGYDYVIIDLGEIYYSLSEFDVSFYQKGNELPFQMTFEVSTKVYVPSISQGAAFEDSDWNYVSIVKREDFIMDEGTNRWHFNDAAKRASVIDGAFGRYIKVTFYYDSMNCGGVYVDEIIASGDDNHDRMNVADGNNIFVDGMLNFYLTDGEDREAVPTASMNNTPATEFVVELVETKTGIQSFSFADITNQEVDVYISAGGDDWHLVDTLTGKDGVYTLAEKVSARRMKFIFKTAIQTSEIRIFGCHGSESFYEDVSALSSSANIVLKSGTITMSNVVSTLATDVTLTSTDKNGTVTTANGAMGLGTGFVLTDGNDAGYANGVSYINTSEGLLWYGLHSSKKGINNYINATFVTHWVPTLDSTTVDFTIGSKTYKFGFNGDAKKGFVVLESGSATPFDYSAVRTDTEWLVEFTVAYSDVTSSNIESNVNYSVTAYEAGANIGSTGTKTYNVDGTTTGWDYADTASSWATINGYTGDVVVTMTLDKVYYGVNMFAISVLDAPTRGYYAPEKIRFQGSLNGIDWTDIGYASHEEIGDYRYYENHQPATAYVYNFSANFEGMTAKYVRAVMTPRAEGNGMAVQEFWVNALASPLKAAGGDSESASFDYKMLWDNDNLYIAIQYEEEEVQFYTATHEYYETYAMTYDTAKWYQNGSFVQNPTTGQNYTNAFAKSNLKYDKETGFFQLDHTIARLNDANVETDSTTGYPTASLDNFKLYKVSTIQFNKGYATTKGHFSYSSASLATSIETSVAQVDNSGASQTLASTSTLNGYILVSDGYALSQDINGKSLSAVPIRIENDTIAADQINNEIVWFFESDENTDMSAYSKTLGNYMIYGFRYSSNSSSFLDNFYFDGITGMMYTKYYLARAYQGLLWENVFSFPRTTEAKNTYFNTTVGGVANVTIDSDNPVDARTYNSAPDFNWNVVKGANGQWNFSLYSQGVESYDNLFDNVDGASSFRLYMSVANLNDTARYDYGNFDFVLDTYVIDDSCVVLKNGSSLPLEEGIDEQYLTANNRKDMDTGWNGYKNVEFKSTALGMTSETNDYRLDVSQIKGKAKMSQSENGQTLMTIEIAIPFSQLGFTMNSNLSEGEKRSEWGNYYSKMGIEKPLGKRTLMQFDAKHGYTQNNNDVGAFNNVDEFYYYVDASEFGYILQMAPEGKGYQDMSYTDGEGYATISSVRSEVLNTENGDAIEYNPSTFNISKIHTTNADLANAAVVSDLKSRDAFKYVEEDGMYYFTSQLDHGRVFNQGGDMSTEIMIPAGGAYFSFDWRVQSETSDTLSVWVEQTDTWNSVYKDWIGTYNCGIPYKKYNSNGSASQTTWTGILDYSDSSMYTLYSEVMASGGTTFQSNNVELKNDACVAFISGYCDTTRNPEEFILASWKECKRSQSTTNFPVNIDDVMVYSPLVGGSMSTDNGMYRHVWDWNNVTIWIPNDSDAAISYTITWMYWKNGSQLVSYNASDGRGTDDAQITNFHLSTTDELGYWKNSENWDTLRLDANVADPSETALGIKELAKNDPDSPNTAISASANLTNDSANNTFGTDSFFTLSHAAIAQKEVVGTTTSTTNYVETKNKIRISAANVPAEDIEKYKNNAIVFTQEYTEIITANSNLIDWTLLELKYNNTYNTWTLNRMFSEGVDKSKFNIYPDDSTIIIAVNYTYDGKVTTNYGETREAVLFGYGNREVLSLLTPEIRYEQNGDRIIETLADAKEGGATQFFTSNIFIRENYNIARGKMYSLRHYPTYSDASYMYTENWFRENNTEDALAAFLAVYAETPLYYVNESGEIYGNDGQPLANTDGDYSKAFVYEYSSGKKLRFDTNQYGDLLYVPAGVGQLTDGDKLSVYSDTYLVEALEDYAIGYFVDDTMGTPDAETVEGIYPNDLQYSYLQTPDAKHDQYIVAEDVNTREENIILDLGTVEYGLSAFTARFAGGGEDGVVFPTSVDFSISSDGLSYYYIGSVALDDTGYNSSTFTDAYASIIYTGATDTVYGNTLADYTFDLQTVGVTARYIKATIMNHSAENAKMFITEFTATQNSIVPDELPKTHASTWIDVSDDASLMYKDTLEMWDRVYGNEYSFTLAPTQAGYLFAEDEGYPDEGRTDSTPGVYQAGQLTDGFGGATLAKADATAPTLDELKAASVGWMKAYAAEVSVTFKLDSDIANVGYVSVYALESKDSVDKINQPFNVTAYVRKSTEENSEWKKVATVNARDNNNSEIALKGMDCVIETEEYYVYKYTLAFARDGELAQQLEDFDEAMIVAETDGGEDGWICLTEVEVYEGHPCYPVYDLTDEKYRKTAINLTSDEIASQKSEVRPTFFRGFYDSDKYYDEIQSSGVYNGHDSGDAYSATMVFNNNSLEQYTLDYVYANVEQRALDGRGVQYYYEGDQLLFRVTNNQLNADEYNVNGDWVSTYKLRADSEIYFNDVKAGGTSTTKLYTTTSVPTPMTVCNVLARDKDTGALPENYSGSGSYYYLPIYMLNSLDYLKNVGYNVDTGDNAARFINMPANKVEITGTVEWDTNTESEMEQYINDKNGISLNLAPMGAKTNTDTITYNGASYDANTTLRFGSIWYIDDAAYYNTHTHRKQYGTIIITSTSLARYFTDTLSSKYRSLYNDYGISLTKLNSTVELTGIEEVTGLKEILKLTGVVEVKKLTNVTEIFAATADDYTFTTSKDGVVSYWRSTNPDINVVSFTTTRNGKTQYWGSDENIDASTGSVWTSKIDDTDMYDYWYCANKNVKAYKFTTSHNGTQYWYCNENVSAISWIGNDENGIESFWYSSDINQTSFENVRYNVLADGETVVYYIDPEKTNETLTNDETAFNIVTGESGGTTRYWKSDRTDVMSWTYTTVEGDTITYWYSPDFKGIAGTIINKDGATYATAATNAYDDVTTTRENTGKTRYWTAKSVAAFKMLTDIKATVQVYEKGHQYQGYPVGYPGNGDRTQVEKALEIFLDYVNKYADGEYLQAGSALTFGGLGSQIRANKYYYYSNISHYLVPRDYADAEGNIFGDYDANNGAYNQTELLGMYNYDQRYLEFDAILAGIPTSQQNSDVVAIPYAIYANNYEFLEFGEILGDGDAYVEDTWHNVFDQYYGNGNEDNNMRYYVYGYGVIRSVNDIKEQK